MSCKSQLREPIEGKEVITLTWGDQAENNIGMQQLGELRKLGDGFTYQELELLKTRFGDSAELFILNDPEIIEQETASILVIRNGVSLFGDENTHINMFKEHKTIEYDKKALMRGQVKNKNARWNICIDDKGQEADYTHGKGTIVSMERIPETMTIVNRFVELFGDKAYNLKGEGNYYYNIDKCGIGFHGDAERRIVIAVRLGASMPLYYQWYKNSKPVGDKIEIQLNGGDIYIMNEKAVGTDWRKRKIYTLRHATGCKKYTTVKK